MNLGLSVWLVHRLGILGVALGTAIPSVLLEYRFLTLVTSLVGMTVSEFLRQVLRPTLLPAVVSFLPAFAIAALAPRQSPALPVIGARLRRGLRRLVLALGDVARGARDGPAAVAVAPDETEHLARAAERAHRVRRCLSTPIPRTCC